MFFRILLSKKMWFFDETDFFGASIRRKTHFFFIFIRTLMLNVESFRFQVALNNKKKNKYTVSHSKR